MSGEEIGRTRCPGCGRQMTVREDKHGKGYACCPWGDEETLDPCATKVFFGRPATGKIKAKIKAQEATAPSKSASPITEQKGGENGDLLF